MWIYGAKEKVQKICGDLIYDKLGAQSSEGKTGFSDVRGWVSWINHVEEGLHSHPVHENQFVVDHSSECK